MAFYSGPSRPLTGGDKVFLSWESIDHVGPPLRVLFSLHQMIGQPATLTYGSCHSSLKCHALLLLLLLLQGHFRPRSS